MKVAMPFARPLVELVFDLLNLGIGEGAQIAALRKVLAQQAVRIFVTAALPSGIRLGEVARRIERDVDQSVFGANSLPLSQVSVCTRALTGYRACRIARIVGSDSPLATRRLRNRPVLRSTSVTMRARPLPTIVSPSQSPP
jgi:hypothetical protein